MFAVTLHRLLAVLVTGLVAAGLFAGCGGSSSSDKSDLPGPSATQVNLRFEKVTGIRLLNDTRFNNDSWSVMSLPDGTDHFDRFGAFSLYVVKDSDARDRLLRKSDDEDSGSLDPNESGYAFRRNEDTDGYSVIQRFGDNVVLVWQAGDKQEVDASYRRLTVAVEAAVTGDENKVPAAQRDCAQAGIDPESGKEGSCRVDDNEITVVNSGSKLHTTVLDARLRSVGDASQIEPTSSYGTPTRAKGRFLIVSYELTNNGDGPIDGIKPQLVVDGRTYAVASDVDYELYGDEKRPLPLQPGDTATMLTAFDIPPAIVDAARDRGALVLPAEADKYGYLSAEDSTSVGRIRLAGAEVDESAGEPQRRTPESSRDSYSDPVPPPPPPSSSTRTIRREHRAERAVKKFYTAVRTGNVSGICNRLTDNELANEGGMAACRGKVVRAAFQSQVPRSNRHLKFTTLLTRSDTRATIMVRGNGYRGFVRLARQDELWRVQSLRKM